jgi:hypothetical protein
LSHLLLIIVVAWVVLAAIALVFVLAIGRAAKRGDEVMWRANLTRMLAARGRRRDERRFGERRSSDPRGQLGWSGALDRRRTERRRHDRRVDPAWRDRSNG